MKPVYLHILLSGHSAELEILHNLGLDPIVHNNYAMIQTSIPDLLHDIIGNAFANYDLNAIVQLRDPESN